LIRRFGGKERNSVFERLARLKQDGRVEEYVKEFEILVGQIPNITKEQLLRYFLGGLQMRIRNQIRPHDPKDLMRAIEILLDLEEAANDEKRGGAITLQIFDMLLERG